MFRFLRTNLVVLLVLASFVVTLALAMVFIDKGVYQQRKRALLFQEGGATLNLDLRAVQQGILRVLASPRDPQAQAELQSELNAQLQRSNGVWSMRLLDRDGVLLAEVQDLARLKTSNSWRNNLFFRDFRSETRSPLVGSTMIFVSYTTPQDIPSIEELTHRFQMIALLIAAAITLAFGTALRMIILPLRRVLTQVQERGAELIRRPRSGLERAYNAVAAEALLARLSQRITGLLQTPSMWTQPEFEPQLIRAVREIFGFQAAALVAVSEDSPRPRIRAMSAAPGVSLPEQAGLHTPVPPDALTHPLLLRDEGEQLGLLVALAPVMEMRDQRIGLMVADPGDWSHMPRWFANVVASVAAEVRRGLVQMPIFRDMLVRQKSAANISLSRSLGHDLTNIIATSKLDILSVQRWLEKHAPGAASAASPLNRRGPEALLAESVRGLLNTTRFMQEIVNIYRAFSYMDEPRWERVNLNDLVSHLTDLFRLTLSQKVRVSLELDSRVGEVFCEPRLVQLALFNLLTNANQAIRRAGNDTAGAIAVATSSAGEEAEISVRDTGPGIRGHDGRLLEGESIYQVFFLGMSMRREGEERGEGLGLNWVWSIITDFHGGRIEPRNRPEGGAEFSLHLPVNGRPGAQTAPVESPPPVKEAAYV